MRPEVGRELRAGAIAILPAAIAVVPFGLLFGAVAAQKGLSPLEVALMSSVVFAGSAQFVAVDIWRDPAPWALLAVSTALVNARHLLMGASLAPKIRQFRTGQSLLALFLMCDEVWAIAERHASIRRISFPFYLGLGVVLYANWVVWTTAGAALGSVLADPYAYGFDFAFTAIFIALLVGLWRGRTTGIPIAASAVSATAVHLAVDGPWYIAAGGIAGALAGAIVGRGGAPAGTAPGTDP